jgi:hypothetical protein
MLSAALNVGCLQKGQTLIFLECFFLSLEFVDKSVGLVGKIQHPELPFEVSIAKTLHSDLSDALRTGVATRSKVDEPIWLTSMKHFC